MKQRDLKSIDRYVNSFKIKDFKDVHLAQDMGNEVFSSLELERSQVAAVMEEDIFQLISIANMKLTGETAPEVSTYLNLALNKLRMLAFEIKPQVLEQFGLVTALDTLLSQRSNSNVHYSIINLHQLPANMSSLVETAVFRLVQQILNSVTWPECINVKLEILRTGHYIGISVEFMAGSCVIDSPGAFILKKKLIKAVQPVQCCFNGHYHFELLRNNRIRFSISLDERKSSQQGEITSL